MERTGKLLLITSLFLCFFGLKGWTRDRATNQPDSFGAPTHGNLYQAGGYDSDA